MDHDGNELRGSLLDVDAGIGLSQKEAIVMNVLIKCAVPLEVPALSHTALHQLTYLVWVLLGDEAFGLHGVDLLVQHGLKEGRIDIHLVDFVVEGRSQSKKKV